MYNPGVFDVAWMNKVESAIREFGSAVDINFWDLYKMELCEALGVRYTGLIFSPMAHSSKQRSANVNTGVHCSDVLLEIAGVGFTHSMLK